MIPHSSFCGDLTCQICGAYIAGFVDGEGCFGIGTRKRRPTGSIRFSIKLRLDDIAILEKIKHHFGCGHVDLLKNSIL